MDSVIDSSLTRFISLYEPAELFFEVIH